ncbi:MAG: hypothetical protein OEW15_10850 [Nitrospirota bacterium]|nr:hypothetical protein [Nitrospirota bacterium]
MKKILVVMVAVMMVMTSVLAGAALAADAGAAAVLSCAIPGAGEWYNGNFKGSFPWLECIAGKICFCVAIASVFDAAAGKSSDSMRIDFWSAPK